MRRINDLFRDAKLYFLKTIGFRSPPKCIDFLSSQSQPL